uniref:Uncharacterized protein n=1 Tax=Brassica oleracea var. oleracea TaxID=109376 RepID=A0A0D3E5E0_BRAOL
MKAMENVILQFWRENAFLRFWREPVFYGFGRKMRFYGFDGSSEWRNEQPLRLAQEWTFAQGLKTHATNQIKILPKAPQLRPDQTARMICKTYASWNKLSKKA